MSVHSLRAANTHFEDRAGTPSWIDAYAVGGPVGDEGRRTWVDRVVLDDGSLPCRELQDVATRSGNRVVERSVHFVSDSHVEHRSKCHPKGFGEALREPSVARTKAHRPAAHLNLI